MQTGPLHQTTEGISESRVKKPVIFVLSVDTEEEFDWNGEFPQTTCDIDNIHELPAFQAFCETLNIRPTYLVDYPVANDPETANILHTIASTNKAEIGAHLHPWCTPPFEGENGEAESHVVNLPRELIAKKLRNLTEKITENIGISPVSFRTGRWGINQPVLEAVIAEGYKVDSSIYPYYSNDYFSCTDALDQPFWPNIENPNTAGTQRQIFELTVTAGFNRPNFPRWQKVHQFMSSPVLNVLHPIGLAWKLNVLRKIYLSPELSSAEDMIALVDAAVASNHPVIHMFLHSSTLLPGKNEFTQTADDKDQLYSSIEQVLQHLTFHHDVSFCTISEASLKLQAGFSDYIPPKQTVSI